METSQGILTRAQLAALQASSAPLAERLQQAAELGYRQAVQTVLARDEEYGIGSMCSQWSAEAVAEDLLEQVGLTPAPPTTAS